MPSALPATSTHSAGNAHLNLLACIRNGGCRRAAAAWGGTRGLVGLALRRTGLRRRRQHYGAATNAGSPGAASHCRGRHLALQQVAALQLPGLRVHRGQ